MRVHTASEVLADALIVSDPLETTTTALALDADPASLPAALAVLRARQGVVIGVTRTRSPVADDIADACDLVLAPPGAPDRRSVPVAQPADEAARLLKIADALPLATVVLADLLRMGASLPPIDALHAESLAYSTLLAGSEFTRWLADRPPRRARDASRPPVRLAREGDVMHVRLDEPERRNAYSAAMRDALVDALTVAEADAGIHRIVLSGEGPAFCAGGDLTEFGSNTDGAQTHLLRTRAGAGAALLRLAPRMHAVIHGPCIGAGIELPAFAADVSADPGTTFRLPEVGMGLIPGAGGTVSIPRRIGRHRTFWLALSGTTISAPTALEWGLIDRIGDATPR